MAAFDLRLTEQGQALLGNALSGESISFTSVQLGDGLENTGAVSSLRATLPVERVIQDGEKISVYATLSFVTLSESFYWREVGLTAKKEGTEEEILFAYGYGGSYSDYIAAENGSSEKRIVLSFFISSDANFTAVIDESLVFPSKAEMESALTQLEKRTLTPYLCEKTGTVYALTGEGSEGITFAYFVPDADYGEGDTFTVNGIGYTAATQKGEALKTKEFASGQITAVILDHQNKTVNFKSAGGVSLPAGSTVIVEYFTENGTFTVPENGMYQITVVSKGGNGGDTYSDGSAVDAGGGGGSSGWACSQLELVKGEEYPITVTTSNSSFGNLLSATCGGNGGSPSGGNAGTASGGNIYTKSGKRGTSGETGYSTIMGGNGAAVRDPQLSKFLSPNVGSGIDGNVGTSPISNSVYSPLGNGAGGTGSGGVMNYSYAKGIPGAIIIELILE